MTTRKRSGTNTPEDEALARIVEIAQAHRLTPERVLRALEGEPAESDGANGVWKRQLLAIAGGLLLLTGLAGVLELVWDGLSPTTRVLAVYGPGLLMLVAGLASVALNTYRQTATPLLIAGSALQTAGLFVLCDEFFPALDPAYAASGVFGLMTAQSGVLFRLLRRSDLLFLLLAAASLFVAAVLNLLGLDEDLIAVFIGLCGLALTHGLERSRWRTLCGLAWVVYAICAGGGLLAWVAGHFPADVLLVPYSIALLLISLRVGRFGLTLIAFGYAMMSLTYYTGRYFADVLGWPIALILLGVLLLGLSGGAMRLRRLMRRG
ncbi:MAG: hypothetical protein Kow0020_13660 [Wenzhouxiangellaceae bacterium]